MELPQTQFDVLQRLAATAGPVTIPDLVGALGLNQAPVTAACFSLQDAGYVSIAESTYEEFHLGPAAEAYVNQPLPERVIVGVLASHGGSCRITEVPGHCALNAGQIGQTLRWLSQRGWVRKDGEMLVLTVPGAPTSRRQLSI